MKILIALVLIIAPFHSKALADDAAGQFKDSTILTEEDASFIKESIDLTTPSDEKRMSALPEDLTRAKIVAVVNKSSIGSSAQTMKVYVDGVLTYDWKISTGREKLEKAKSEKVYVTTTPMGYFRPTRLVKNHHSKTWDADMPNAVFFYGGIATHATTHVEDLGKRASGGCVRNTLDQSKIFFDLVKTVGTSMVPVITRSGKTSKNKKGEPILQKLYDVLIIVENKI